MSYEAWIGIEQLEEQPAIVDGKRLLVSESDGFVGGVRPVWWNEVMAEILRLAGAKQWWICEFQGASTPWRCKSYEHPDCRYRWVL